MRTDNDYVCSDKKAYIEFKQLRQRVKELEGELLSAAIESTQTAQVEKLRQRVAELEADNQSLKMESRDACMGLNDFYEHKLAASQLENKRLRSALENIVNTSDPSSEYRAEIRFEIAEKALREPTDTDALEKYVADRLGEPVAIVGGGQTYWDIEVIEGTGDLGNGTKLFALKEPK